MRCRFTSAREAGSSVVSVYTSSTIGVSGADAEVEQKRSSIRQTLLQYVKRSARLDTNCDIFSWVSSQLADCIWNMAAIAASSSSFAIDVDSFD